MIDNHFRAILPGMVQPLIRFYSRVGLTPNRITMIAFAIALVAAGLCGAGYGVAAAAVWWLGRLFDGTDGIFARATGQTSDFGAYLDILGDMAAYSVMILGFFWLHPNLGLTWSLILLLYVLCIASALALGSIEQSRKRPARDDRGLRLGAGLAEGGETGIAYTLFLLFPAHIGVLSKVWILILITTVVARSLLARKILAPENTAA